MPDDHDEQVRTVARLLDGQRFAMLTTRAADGTLTSRPMALQEVEFDGDLWFFASASSRKVEHVAGDPRVGVTVSSGSTWVSVSGSGARVEDQDKKRELWNAGIEAWFPDGVDSPEVVLLRVEAEGAEYWDTPGGRVTTALSFVKAKATGKRYAGGDNDRVELSEG